MTQLELHFLGSLSLRAALDDYFARNTEGLAEATVQEYKERAGWLLRELGEGARIDRIDYDVLDSIVRRYSATLAHVTIKRRLVFLRAVLKFAQTRGLIEKVPALPKLRDDSSPRTVIHTVEQWGIFRSYLPPGPFRRIYDLGFWTGHHTSDLFTMTRSMLDRDRPFFDESGREIWRGGFLRRNHKNRRCQPAWMNMQPELRLLVPELLADSGKVDGLITGSLWNVRRTFHMAADRATSDGLSVPRCSPIDLRRSCASMLVGRGYPPEYVRQLLGHAGEDSWTQGGRTTRPTTASRHYMQMTPALMSRGIPVR